MEAREKINITQWFSKVANQRSDRVRRVFDTLSTLVNDETLLSREQTDQADTMAELAAKELTEEQLEPKNEVEAIKHLLPLATWINTCR